MKKALPEKMFAEAEQSRLTMLRAWVLDQGVTEIEMSERQFWTFAGLLPLLVGVAANSRLLSARSGVRQVPATP